MDSLPTYAPRCGDKPASILTFSGQILDLSDPNYDQISVADIAHGLAGEVRYNAQSPGRETVAQHCALLCKWTRMQRGVDHNTLTLHVAVKPLVEKYGAPDWTVVAACLLFHDAPEAFLGDIVSPLKRLPQMQWFRELEDLHMARCARRFGLPPLVSPVWEFVSALDHAIVIDEKLALWPGMNVSDRPRAWGLSVSVPQISMERAYLEWLSEYEIVMRELQPIPWAAAQRTAVDEENK